MRFLFTVFLMLFLALPTYADEQKSSGMKYTTIGDKPQEREKKHLHIKRITPVPSLKKEEEKPAEEPPPFTRIWNKYKSLAAGEGDDSEVLETAKAAEARDTSVPPPAPALTSEEQESAAPVGLEGILSNYYKNKQDRARMQSRNIAGSEESTTTTVSQE